MTGGLRILYVGQLWEGGTCLQRLRAVEELGHQVAAYDAHAPLRCASRLVQAVQARTGVGVGICRVNRDFLAAARASRPALIWVDKGQYLWRRSVEAAKRGGSLLVHYNPDDPFGAGRRGWRHFLSALPSYDVHFVPRDPNLAEYRKAGAARVVRCHWGYDRTLHRPVEVSREERARLGGAVGFIGNCERARAESLARLAASGVGVRVWGPNWQPYRGREPRLTIEGRALLGIEYAKAICAFDINLAFLHKGNRDQSTTRSFEIPACGGFMLAERTAEHLALYDEGKEAEFFAQTEELEDKVTYYSTHAGDRMRIASAGRERCRRGGYSNHERMQAMLRTALSGR